MTSGVLESTQTATTRQQVVPCGTRNLTTSSGETRSQLFQRLRAEFVWQDAEVLKQQIRSEARSRGMTKRESGVAAWNAVADTYPIPDAQTWHALMTRSLKPPLVSTAADVTDETTTIVNYWTGSIRLIASLATRCDVIGANRRSLIRAIDVRQTMEPAGSCVLNDDGLKLLDDYMLANPNDVVVHSQRLFSAYLTTESSYSDAVADELRNLNQVLELVPELIEKQWPRVSAWLWGPRCFEVRRTLTRACEKQALMSSPDARTGC